jgi:hypothetical protein
LFFVSLILQPNLQIKQIPYCHPGPLKRYTKRLRSELEKAIISAHFLKSK